jgi:hypothetical protein
MKNLLSTLALLCILLSANAQKQIFHYEGKPAGSENWTWEEANSEENLFNSKVVYNVSRPSITAYVPENPNGTAIVIAPGGAFHTLSIDSEGIDVAKWLNAKGVTAFVLKYRVARSFTDDPLKEIMGKMSNFQTLDEENKAVVPLATQDGMKAVNISVNMPPNTKSTKKELASSVFLRVEHSQCKSFIVQMTPVDRIL